MGGCHLIHICLFRRRCCSNSFVRRLSLTPNGTSINYVLEFILHDLGRVVHSGISAIYWEGELCVVYIDVAGFVVDFPASSTAIDCMSHDANTLCTHCSFRTLDGPDEKFKSFHAHHCTIHSGTAIFVRGFEKKSYIANRTLTMEIATISE